MLTLQRTATETGVILELEGVHEAGPRLVGDCLIHFIFFTILSTCYVAGNECMFICSGDHNDNDKYVQCRISIREGR